MILMDAGINATVPASNSTDLALAAISLYDK